MIKVLVDTNVIVNYLTHREDKYRESSIQVMEACSAKELEGYVAFSFAVHNIVLFRQTERA